MVGCSIQHAASSTSRLPVGVEPNIDLAQRGHAIEPDHPLARGGNGLRHILGLQNIGPDRFRQLVAATHCLATMPRHRVEEQLSPGRPTAHPHCSASPTGSAVSLPTARSSLPGPQARRGPPGRTTASDFGYAPKARDCVGSGSAPLRQPDRRGAQRYGRVRPIRNRPADYRPDQSAERRGTTPHADTSTQACRRSPHRSPNRSASAAPAEIRDIDTVPRGHPRVRAAILHGTSPARASRLHQQPQPSCSGKRPAQKQSQHQQGNPGNACAARRKLEGRCAGQSNRQKRVAKRSQRRNRKQAGDRSAIYPAGRFTRQW